MTKLIGFSESITSECPRFRINNLIELKPSTDPAGSYSMVHDGLSWGIGYQRAIRYFLDDGTFVDFADDFEGHVQFLKDYLARGEYIQPRRKLEVASEVEFMDI